MKLLLFLLLTPAIALAQEDAENALKQCISQHTMLATTYNICATRLKDINTNYNLLLYYFIEVADEYNRRHRLIRKLKIVCGERCRGISQGSRRIK